MSRLASARKRSAAIGTTTTRRGRAAAAARPTLTVRRVHTEGVPAGPLEGGPGGGVAVAGS
jgi:hypothetical protein